MEGSGAALAATDAEGGHPSSVDHLFVDLFAQAGASAFARACAVLRQFGFLRRPATGARWRVGVVHQMVQRAVRNHLIMAAPGDDTVSRDAGAAYLFTGPLSGTMVLPDANYIFYGDIRDSSAGAGTKLADMDGDGVAEIMVGAPTDNTGGNSAGSVSLLDVGL